jgi:hypothetical protein
MALKQNDPQMYEAENKLSPDEFDYDMQYTIQYPDVGTARLGTVNVTADGLGTFTVGQPFLDAPRTVTLSILGVAGGMGGTATVTGKDQFGNAVSEALGFATAAGGGTAQGTKVFAKVSTAIVNIAGLGGTAIGSCYLGYPLGDVAMTLGLPVRLGGTSDLKRVTWHDAGVSKALTVGTGGTIGTAVAGTAMSSVTLTGLGGFATADSYTFVFRSSYPTESKQFTT